MWGFHYARIPLETQIGLDVQPVDSSALWRELRSETLVLDSLRKSLVGNDSNALHGKRFWPAKAEDTVRAAVEKWLLTRNEDKDISRLHQWSEATLLGKHSPQTTKNEELVLLIRAEFIRKYPNTLTYLVEKDSKGKPILSDAKKMAFPIFEAQLPPDILCLGFPFDEAEARKRHIVFEERLSEHRFGLDDASAIEMVAQSTGKSIDQVLAEASIENLSWQHFPAVGPGQYLDDQPPSKANPKIQNKWAAGGAPYSAVAFTQKQVRVVVDLDKLLPL